MTTSSAIGKRNYTISQIHETSKFHIDPLFGHPSGFGLLCLEYGRMGFFNTFRTPPIFEHPEI